MTLRLILGRELKFCAELELEDEERLRELLNARFEARQPKPTPQLSDVARAAIAVDAAHQQGR